MQTIGEIGERELIQRLCRHLGASPELLVGAGDDCAVVPAGKWNYVLTTDPVVEGVHFLPGEEGARVGYKAVGRVLSDIAAMGAEPLWLLIDVVCPATVPVSWMEAVYTGAGQLLAQHGAAVIGGDVARGPVVELHVFGVGRVPNGTAVLRSGAMSGDALYVTGALGGSLQGRHLRFEPRIAEGCWLREGNWVTAMIDLSDGPGTDLMHLAECSHLGFELAADQIPVTAESGAGDPDGTPLEHALSDGEDFELLFTVPTRRKHAFEQAWRERFTTRCTCVGRMIVGGCYLIDAAGRHLFTARGFEHFSGDGL